MKKLLIWGISNRGGGSETFLYNVLNTIINENLYVITLYIPLSRYHIYNKFISKIQIELIPDDKVNNPVKRLLFENITMKKTLKRNFFDLIFIPSEIIPFFWKMLKTKIIINYHSTLQLSNQFIRKNSSVRTFYESLMRRNSLKKTNGIIFVSHLSKEQISFKYNIDEKKSFVVYHGVVKPNLVHKKPIFDFPYLLAVGDRYIHKNYDFLISLYSYYVDKYNSNAHLVIIGRQKNIVYDRLLESMIEKKNINDRVHFIENVDHMEMGNYYKQSLMLISSSSYESFGITPLEAMINKRPTLLKWCSSLPEIYNNISFFYDDKLETLEEISDKINEIVQGSKNIINKVQLAFEFAYTMSWEKTAYKYIKIFEIITKG